MSQQDSGRIARAITRSHQRGSKALIAYLTAGDPSPDRTVPLILALERGGTDVLELGVPFSDPIADGPVIQRASEHALSTGTTVRTVLQVVRDLRVVSALPVVLFSYLNPVLRYGFKRFAADAAEAGVDGALLTDLTIEESELYVSHMRAQGLDCVFLATQTTPSDRIAEIARLSSGFLYLVSRAGVTGIRKSISSDASPLAERAREVTNLHLALGFGLSTRAHMQEVAPYSDAAVAGTAFMRLIAENRSAEDLEERVETLARELKAGLEAGPATRMASNQ